MHHKTLLTHIHHTGKLVLPTYLKEIVYGGNDGIVTTFAVVAGFAGAKQQDFVALPLVSVMVFGFANLFADALSMGLGNFLSSLSERDLYKKEYAKLQKRIEETPRSMRELTHKLLLKQGFDQTEATNISRSLQTNPKFYSAFLLSQSGGIQNPDTTNPAFMALATFLSFTAFGILPLMPFLILPANDNLFTLSVVMTGAALIALGTLRYFVTGQSLFRSLAETTALGGLAAAVAYGVGTAFSLLQ